VKLSFYPDGGEPELHLTPETPAERRLLLEHFGGRADYCPDGTAVIRGKVEGWPLGRLAVEVDQALTMPDRQWHRPQDRAEMIAEVNAVAASLGLPASTWGQYCQAGRGWGMHLVPVPAEPGRRTTQDRAALPAGHAPGGARLPMSSGITDPAPTRLEGFDAGGFHVGSAVCRAVGSLIYQAGLIDVLLYEWTVVKADYPVPARVANEAEARAMLREWGATTIQESGGRKS
jgi:hypothetical protein